MLAIIYVLSNPPYLFWGCSLAAAASSEHSLSQIYNVHCVRHWHLCFNFVCHVNVLVVLRSCGRDRCTEPCHKPNSCLLNVKILHARGLT
jgi:hypothetical protein